MLLLRGSKNAVEMIKGKIPLFRFDQFPPGDDANQRKPVRLDIGKIMQNLIRRQSVEVVQVLMLL